MLGTYTVEHTASHSAHNLLAACTLFVVVAMAVLAAVTDLLVPFIKAWLS